MLTPTELFILKASFITWLIAGAMLAILLIAKFIFEAWFSYRLDKEDHALKKQRSRQEQIEELRDTLVKIHNASLEKY